MRILITGATGFVGSALAKKLLNDGHELNILTRDIGKIPEALKDPRVKAFEWRDTKELPPVESISQISGVINLMGENIAAKRWSPEQKKKLRDSRILATTNLTTLLDQNLNSSLEFFISASAVGIYPVNLPDVMNEESKIGKNFLAELCKDWESAAYTLKKVKRTVIIRTSVVLEAHGGALAKMLPPFKLGLGGPIGDGNQYMSWIHLDDLCDIYATAVTDSTYNGIYNGVAPHPVENFHFTKALGNALHRPTIFPVPEIGLKIAFGEMSSVILDSQKIVSKNLHDKNFPFKYETIEKAFSKMFQK